MADTDVRTTPLNRPQPRASARDNGFGRGTTVAMRVAMMHRRHAMRAAAWIILGATACGGGSANTIDAPRATTGDLYLTVMDIGGHCSVTVNDEEPFTSAEETLADFDSGQTVPLTASAVTGFTLGLWHHTTNDTGSGDPGTIADAESSATVTLSDTPGCVWICCSSESSDCPTTDQCP